METKTETADLEVYLRFKGTTYRLAAHRRGSDLTVYLRKTDTTVYKIEVVSGQPVACNCPDYLYRKHSPSSPCKHMRSVRRLCRVFGVTHEPC